MGLLYDDTLKFDYHLIYFLNYNIITHGFFGHKVDLLVTKTYIFNNKNP